MRAPRLHRPVAPAARSAHARSPRLLAGSVLLFIVSVLLLIVSLTGPALAQEASPRGALRIVGGQVERGFPAVGALLYDGEQGCTGTLVTPTVVVTAAHCLEEVSAREVSFFRGPDARNLDAGTRLQAVELRMHPDYDTFEVVNDIGVVRLAEPAPVQPMARLMAEMSDEWVGRNVLFVGYGITDAMVDDAGIKRSVQIELTEVADTWFRYAGPGVNTCNGDSGGPAIVELDGQPTLIGVTSWGDEDCAEFGVDTRTDVFEAFIKAFIDGQPPANPGDGPDPGDGPAPGEGDFCEEMGWYGDGVCDMDCPNPDPDCEGDGGDWPDPGEGDFCEEMGWYGDGVCDMDCPSPDPDCEGDGGADPGDPGDPGDGDICEEMGWYNDGVCDEGCAQPDPDCGDAPPTDEPPVDEPPLDEPPSGESPHEEPPVDVPPAGQPPEEDPHAEDPPVDGQVEPNQDGGEQDEPEPCEDGDWRCSLGSGAEEESGAEVAEDADAADGSGGGVEADGDQDPRAAQGCSLTGRSERWPGLGALLAGLLLLGRRRTSRSER